MLGDAPRTYCSALPLQGSKHNGPAPFPSFHHACSTHARRGEACNSVQLGLAYGLAGRRVVRCRLGCPSALPVWIVKHSCAIRSEVVSGPADYPHTDAANRHSVVRLSAPHRLLGEWGRPICPAKALQATFRSQRKLVKLAAEILWQAILDDPRPVHGRLVDGADEIVTFPLCLRRRLGVGTLHGLAVRQPRGHLG